MTPFEQLVRSRRFWLVISDTIVSIVTLLVTRWLSPADVEFVLKFITMLQPLVGLLITVYTISDAIEPFHNK